MYQDDDIRAMQEKIDDALEAILRIQRLLRCFRELLDDW